MGKSTGFSQSVHGLIQFMGKGTKHPHILYMCSLMKTHTPPFIYAFQSPILTAQVDVMDVILFFFFAWCLSQHHIMFVCMQVNICALQTQPPRMQGSHEPGSSVPTLRASLTLRVLLKVRVEETLRGHCPLEPSCATVSSLLTAYSLFCQSVCLYWQVG